MDKEIAVHRHNAVLLSHRKERIWFSSNEVDEPRAYYTEWSKSERERQILYTNAFTWNLERQYWWSYMQGSKGDTDIKNWLLDSVGEGKSGMIWENSIDTCITKCQHKFNVWSRTPKASALRQPEGIEWGGKWDVGVRMEGTHVCLWPIHVDVWQKLQSNYPPIKVNK